MPCVSPTSETDLPSIISVRVDLKPDKKKKKNDHPLFEICRRSFTRLRFYAALDIVKICINRVARPGTTSRDENKQKYI